MAKAKPDYIPGVAGFCRIIAWTIFRLLHGHKAQGTNHIPDSGPVILAPNHASYYDPPLVAYIIPRPVYFLAWVELFRNKYFGRFIRSLGAVPVEPVNGLDRSAYTTALHVLESDDVLCIFPEGARTTDGRLRKLRSGIARLSIQTGAPIVPVRLIGTLQSWHVFRAIPRPFVPFRTEYLPPIYPNKVETPEERRTEIKRLIGLVEEAIRPVEETYSPISN